MQQSRHLPSLTTLCIPFWDDLDLRTAGNVYYQNDAANNRFIVEYKKYVLTILQESFIHSGNAIQRHGRIFYQYLDMTASLVNSCTIGTRERSRFNRSAGCLQCSIPAQQSCYQDRERSCMA
ncbi:MAG: hypothetical protein R2942_16815 [Ignavibacteria bacterium]